MGIRTAIFVLLFLICTIGAFGMPLLGLLGYMAHYVIGPERQWWAAPLQQYDIRYSFTLAAVAAVGCLLHWRSLRYGTQFLTFQEKLFLSFLAMAWLVRAISEPTALYTVVDHPTLKLTKVFLFSLMLTHVVTDCKSLKAVFWTLTISMFLVAIQAYNTPRSAFEGGRLEGIGGVDFNESNFLCAFIVGVLPLMGVLFLDSRWLGKLVILAAGVFSVNTIVLTRSRGAVVGMVLGGVVAVVLAPKGYRKLIAAGLVVAGLGFVYLSDPAFLSRLSTITREEEERDISAQSRIELWHVSRDIVRDYPQGIGPGNFFQFAGRYDARYEGRDVHNTYLRCATEVGVVGFLLFIALIANAFVVLIRTMRKARALPAELQKQILLPAYGLAVGLCMMLGTGLTVTLVYTEALWWFLMMPVCMERIMHNLAADAVAKAAAAIPVEEVL